MRPVYGYDDFISESWNGKTLTDLQDWQLESLSHAVVMVMDTGDTPATPQELYNAIVFILTPGNYYYQHKAYELLQDLYKDRRNRSSYYASVSEAMRYDFIWNKEHRYLITCLEILSTHLTKKSWRNFTYGYKNISYFY